ncbi:MAG: NAD(P)-dependent oxidoreductase [Novosphingobium sp.]|nr:NAD(P)-dependent oxidoreductase [Novosphingobium sp.]
MASATRPIVLITGVTGKVGGAVAKGLGDAYQIVGIDEHASHTAFPVIEADLTKDVAVAHALDAFRDAHGAHIASVIHLAAYFDFTGADNPLYQRLNVDGTRRLLEQLQRFQVEQFVYSGTMLVHAPVEPGEHIDENRRLDPQWAYPKSKAAAERVIETCHGGIPYLLFHLAGVYDDETLVPTMAHQVARIHERDLESHVYPGNLATGQSMVHLDDLAAAFRLAVDKRASLPPATTILIGEPDPPGYGELQDRLGELIHGEEWTTIRVPATLAAAGAWVQDKVMPHLPKSLGGGKPFIRPFMALEAGDHYALDITRARDLLGWAPKHRLLDTLPEIVARLKRDPKAWYEANELEPPPEVAGS